MVRRDGPVYSVCIKEITEPLVIHTLRGSISLITFLHCQAGFGTLCNFIVLSQVVGKTEHGSRLTGEGWAVHGDETSLDSFAYSRMFFMNEDTHTQE